MVRSLALRTMGCLRVEKIIEYLCDPLSQCLKVCLFVVEIGTTFLVGKVADFADFTLLTYGLGFASLRGEDRRHLRRQAL